LAAFVANGEFAYYLIKIWIAKFLSGLHSQDNIGNRFTLYSGGKDSNNNLSPCSCFRTSHLSAQIQAHSQMCNSKRQTH